MELAFFFTEITTQPSTMSARVAQTSLRAVRVLRNVVEKSWKLEAAWKHETQSLPKHESQLLRDVSSGTLRHLHEYSRLIDYCAPSHQLTDDVVLRLLAASTLYQIHHSERLAFDGSALARCHSMLCSSREAVGI